MRLSLGRLPALEILNYSRLENLNPLYLPVDYVNPQNLRIFPNGSALVLRDIQCKGKNIDVAVGVRPSVGLANIEDDKYLIPILEVKSKTEAQEVARDRMQSGRVKRCFAMFSGQGWPVLYESTYDTPTRSTSVQGYSILDLKKLEKFMGAEGFHNLQGRARTARRALLQESRV